MDLVLLPIEHMGHGRYWRIEIGKIYHEPLMRTTTRCGAEANDEFVRVKREVADKVARQCKNCARKLR